MQVLVCKYLSFSYDVRVTSLTLLLKLSKVVFLHDTDFDQML